jgi:hypothetical protein
MPLPVVNPIRITNLMAEPHQMEEARSTSSSAVSSLYHSASILPCISMSPDKDKAEGADSFARSNGPLSAFLRPNWFCSLRGASGTLPESY